MSTAALFERLAPRYDELWTDTAVGRAQRDAVWRVTDKLFCAGDRILDVGCGTGEDAAHMIARGISVHAVDASPAMVARARARGVAAEVMRVEDVARTLVPAAPRLVSASPVFVVVPEEGRDESRPGRQECLRHEDSLIPPGGACFSLPKLFDGVISNFGALNCVADLAAVARALGALVRPGGHLAICTMGRFCLWETLYYAVRFRFQKAFRRFPGHAGDVYYPTVRQLRADFSADFELLHWAGIGMLVPPSYVNLPASVVHLLARVDRLPFLRACADHRLLVFRRK